MGTVCQQPEKMHRKSPFMHTSDELKAYKRMSQLTLKPKRNKIQVRHDVQTGLDLLSSLCCKGSVKCSIIFSLEK